MFQMFNSNNYDVIFTDIRMPRLNGIDASKKIFDSAKYPKPFIVAVTANSLNQDIQLYKENGIKWHLSKPINIGELKNIIKELHYYKENLTN